MKYYCSHQIEAITFTTLTLFRLISFLIDYLVLYFRDWPIEKLSEVRVADALKHPNWAMGAKITVDSATMVQRLDICLRVRISHGHKYLSDLDSIIIIIMHCLDEQRIGSH